MTFEHESIKLTHIRFLFLATFRCSSDRLVFFFFLGHCFPVIVSVIHVISPGAVLDIKPNRATAQGSRPFIKQTEPQLLPYTYSTRINTLVFVLCEFHLCTPPTYPAKTLIITLYMLAPFKHLNTHTLQEPCMHPTFCKYPP